jgi:polyhydroxybutyrate depolymerase
MKNTVLFAFAILSSMWACKKDNPPIDDYVIGKNWFNTTIDGDIREYLVHVPSIYNSDSPTPVVFMLHGTTGFGERFYNISGWKELGEVENILTVYPSSWKYCFIDDGVVKNTTRWNVIQNVYCPGETPRDDIKFLRQVVAELHQRFNVDSKRIYIAGFSNGGAMAGRCAVEMSDIFAAAVEASGVLPKDTTFTPVRQVPVTFQLGNSDDSWLGSSSFSIPMTGFDSLINNHPVFKGLVYTHTSTFGMETSYTKTGDTSTYLTATYPGNTASPAREFNFILIKGLEHNYPNGNNHPLIGAQLHWDWMKQFTLP